jgi:type I restriction enzyme S subunit
VPTEAELARAEGRGYEPAAELLKRILAERRRRWEEAELARLTAAGKPAKDDEWKARYQEPEEPKQGALPRLPEGWCWSTVEGVGDVLLGRQRAPQYLTGRHSRPYLRVANIKDDAIDLTDVGQMDFDPAHLGKYRLQPGDILVSEGQSPELVGQSAIYRGGIDGLCFQKTLHRFRPALPGPSSEFAQIVFRAHVRTGIFSAVASITTNIAHLTLEKFKAAPFPLPPAAEQDRIVQECQRLMTLADDVEYLAGASGQRSGRLRQSILKWAFEGRLVDQDPSDEAASVLLGRIQQERAPAGETAAKSRKARARKAR